jgi:molecular chaperone HtpG
MFVDSSSSHLDYITHMPKVKKYIYLISELLTTIHNSPSLGEVLKKKGFNTNPINKYVIVQLKEFHGKKLICCRYYQQQVNNSEQPLTMVL